MTQRPPRDPCSSCWASGDGAQHRSDIGLKVGVGGRRKMGVCSRGATWEFKRPGREEEAEVGSAGRPCRVCLSYNNISARD